MHGTYDIQLQKTPGQGATRSHRTPVTLKVLFYSMASRTAKLLCQISRDPCFVNLYVGDFCFRQLTSSLINNALTVIPALNKYRSETKIDGVSVEFCRWRGMSHNAVRRIRRTRPFKCSVRLYEQGNEEVTTFQQNNLSTYNRSGVHGNGGAASHMWGLRKQLWRRWVRTKTFHIRLMPKKCHPYFPKVSVLGPKYYSGPTQSSKCLIKRITMLLECYATMISSSR